jgi:hypothetical protein
LITIQVLDSATTFGVPEKSTRPPGTSVEKRRDRSTSSETVK